jgi:hypothetical protein
LSLDDKQERILEATNSLLKLLKKDWGVVDGSNY